MGTYDKNTVEKKSGFANLHLTNTWIYSKHKMHSPLQFGGKLERKEVAGITEGDVIAVYADPQERLGRFYKNGMQGASNLPDSPLPVMQDHPLRMYVMVDAVFDEIAVTRFGPGEPY